MLVKKRPNRKDFGYELPNPPDKEWGWDAYNEAVEEYETTDIKLNLSFKIDSFIELNAPVSIQIEQYAGKNRYGLLDEDCRLGPDMYFSISSKNGEKQRLDIEESVRSVQNQYPDKKIHFLIIPIEHV